MVAVDDTRAYGSPRDLASEHRRGSGVVTDALESAARVVHSPGPVVVSSLGRLAPPLHA